MDRVRTLLERGENPNELCGGDETPLTLASAKGHHGIVYLLMNCGVIIDTASVRLAVVRSSWRGHEITTSILCPRIARDGKPVDDYHEQLKQLKPNGCVSWKLNES